MTKQEFITAWDLHQLRDDFAQYQYDNYPDTVTFEDFQNFMITEEL